MKKQIKHLLLALGLVAISTNVSAKEINKNEIPENSYVIGNHVFTENTILTTRHIMLASKTIEGNSLDNMIIYYKAPGGTWMEGLSGEELNVPDKFDIYYRDLIEESLKKIGIDPMLEATTGQWLFYPEFDEKTIAETTSGNIKEYEFEIYEKIGSDYTFMGSTTLNPKRGGPVAVDATNEVKTYVGRIALTNSKGEKIYSEYSDEVTVNAKDVLGKPVLKHGCSGTSCSLWINYNKEIANEVNFEVYEKTADGYAEVGSAISNGGEAGTAVNVELTSESKIYVARYYITNSKGEKVYSGYSNEIILVENNVVEIEFGGMNPVEDALAFVFKNDVYKKYTNMEILYMNDSNTNWQVYSDSTIDASGQFSIKKDIYNGSTSVKVRLYNIVDGNKLYSNECVLSDIIQLESSGTSTDEENKTFTASYKFTNDVYTKYTNIEVLYMYDGLLRWTLPSSNPIESTEVFNLKYDMNNVPTYIKVRLYRTENGIKVYSQSYLITGSVNDVPELSINSNVTDPDTGKTTVSYKFTNDNYRKYTNIDVLYKLEKDGGWTQYYNGAINGDGIDINYDQDNAPIAIKVRFYNIIEGDMIYSNECTITDVPQLEESSVLGIEEENKQKIVYKFKNDIYSKYTNIEVLYMYEGQTNWKLYSDAIASTEEFEVEQVFGNIPVKVKVRLYNVVEGQRVYSGECIMSYDPNTPLIVGNGISGEPETNNQIVSYMFKNDIYMKYTNIEVSYMYKGETEWQLYSDTIDTNKTFSIKYDNAKVPSKIRIRLYKTVDGQRVYSNETII